MTYVASDIYSGTLANRTREQYPVGAVQADTRVYHPRRGVLTARATYRPMTSAHERIRCSISLRGVGLAAGDRRRRGAILDTLGRRWRLTAASTDTPAVVRCDCEDFFWVWSRALKSDGGLSGPVLEPYRPGWQRRIRNPGGCAGACKHILALAERLRDEGLLRCESPDGYPLPVPISVRQLLDEAAKAGVVELDRHYAAGGKIRWPRLARVRESEY